MVSGHIHESLGVVQVGKTIFANPGSISRTRRDLASYSRTIEVLLVNVDKTGLTVEEIPLPGVRPALEVFGRREVDDGHYEPAHPWAVRRFRRPPKPRQAQSAHAKPNGPLPSCCGARGAEGAPQLQERRRIADPGAEFGSTLRRRRADRLPRHPKEPLSGAGQSLSRGLWPGGSRRSRRRRSTRRGR